MQFFISTAVVLGLFVVLPLWIVFSLRRMSIGELMYGPQGNRKSRGGIGNALQELNRMLTKPSIEHRIEAEDHDKLTEDEKSGE